MTKHIKKDNRSENCINCNKSFSEIKYHAVNMCQICYNRQKSNTYYHKSKYSECQLCNITIGETNPKGKVIERLICGFCKYCYYINRKTACKNCSKCGVEFLTTKPDCLCDLCKPTRRTAPAKVKKFRRGDLVSRKQLSREQLSQMLTLFRRYKNGTQSIVDHFRVASLYLEVFEGHPFVYNSMLDSYNEESQVVLMLRQLKSVYDNV